MTDTPPPAELPETRVPAPRAGDVAAASVISEFLRVQADSVPRSAFARFFGRSPLSDEARPWYLGALGELTMAARLTGLKSEWTVLHSVPVGTRGSDIDHLIIGPGGVFTINTKFHEGARVWLASRRLLVNGQKTDHLRSARFEASRVAKLLTDAANAPISASGIVALVGIRQLTVKSRPDDVVVLRDTELVRWLHKRPEVLASDLRTHLTSVASLPSTWGSAGLEPDLAAFARIRRTVEAARRVRITWAAAVLAVATASLVGVSQMLLQSLL